MMSCLDVHKTDEMLGFNFDVREDPKDKTKHVMII